MVAYDCWEPELSEPPPSRRTHMDSDDGTPFLVSNAPFRMLLHETCNDAARLEDEYVFWKCTDWDAS
jgi:hypothetical protein